MSQIFLEELYLKGNCGGILATQKKSTSKKAGTSSKSKKDLTPNSDTQGFGSIIGGWALVAFGLFLASQVLCVPQNKTLIIDEPELHLHRTIMYHLWSELEKVRPDCLFIYITHDLDFVSSHIVSDIYWVKSYDGNGNWQIEKIESDDVPADLQAEILGSRKPILFVEGEKNSFDTQLYSAIYPNYYVIGCQKLKISYLKVVIEDRK